MSKITIGAASVEVLGANVKRINASFNNQSEGGQSIYFDNVPKAGLTADNAGYVLAAGQSINFVLFFDGEDIKLPWSFVASGADAILYYKEMTQYRTVK